MLGHRTKCALILAILGAGCTQAPPEPQDASAFGPFGEASVIEADILYAKTAGGSHPYETAGTVTLWTSSEAYEIGYAQVHHQRGDPPPAPEVNFAQSMIALIRGTSLGHAGQELAIDQAWLSEATVVVQYHRVIQGDNCLVGMVVTQAMAVVRLAAPAEQIRHGILLREPDVAIDC